MNKAISLLALIKSLSKAEKRYLKLYSNLQNGEKGYLILFELLENNTSIDDIYKQFCIKQKGKVINYNSFLLIFSISKTSLFLFTNFISKPQF